MVKRPFKYLPVGGHRIPIKGLSQDQLADRYVEFGGEDDGLTMQGVFIGHENMIYIDKDSESMEWISTLFHEHVEAINSIFALELDHRQISVLGESLFQAYGKTIHKLTGGKE